MNLHPWTNKGYRAGYWDSVNGRPVYLTDWIFNTVGQGYDWLARNGYTHARYHIIAKRPAR